MMTVIALVSALFSAPASADLDLTGLPIVVSDGASELEITAARELQRYARLITGVQMPVHARRSAARGIIIGTPESMPMVASVLPEQASDETHVILADKGRGRLLIVGKTPVAAQQGVYDLVERLGVGFYLGGDALPERRSRITVPAQLTVVAEPAFRVRGSLPWYNFLNSPTTWNLEDFRSFFDQMAKMRMNFVGFHVYDHEPFAAVPGPTGWVHGAPAATSKTYGWGALRGLATDEFGFGTGDLFGQPVFGSRASVDAANDDDAIRRAQCVLAQGLQYAKQRGVRTCVGFELGGDPTNRDTQAFYERKLRHTLAMYPMADAIWLWQSEGLGGGAQGSQSPKLEAITRQLQSTFAYLESDARIAEAARVTEFVRFAYAVIRLVDPDIQIIVSGWGGDRWMRFSDFYLGLDQLLPPDVVFAALDNIDPSWESNVSHVYGELSPGRERWPIPWFESDGGGARRDQWGPQANVAPFTALCRDALDKGCQGMLGIHWQTRGVEEVAAYLAQFAWNPSLTYEGFYDTYAERCYGPSAAKEMSQIHRELESLGPRWTGSLGQVECGTFSWFSDTRRPQEANLRALARIERRVRLLRQSAAPRHRERFDYLLATIRFVTAYDQAALAIDGPEGLAGDVARAEALAAEGANRAAAEVARQTREGLLNAGLDEAMWAYEPRLTSQGDYGNLATINVKAYAAWLDLWERANDLLPSEQRQAPPRYVPPGLHLLAKGETGVVPSQAALAVRCCALSEAGPMHVRLHWRVPGSRWLTTTMAPTRNHGFLAQVPGTHIGPAGIEYYIDATDGLGRRAVWPSTAPDTPATASAHPYQGPELFGPVVVRGIERAPACAIALAVSGMEYEPILGRIMLPGYGEPPTGVIYHRLMTPLGPSVLDRDALFGAVCVWSEAGSRIQGAYRELWRRPAEPPPPVDTVRADTSTPYSVAVRWATTYGRHGVHHYVVHRGTEPGFALTPGTQVDLAFMGEWVDSQPPLGETAVYAVAPIDEFGQQGAAAYSEPVQVPSPPLVGPPSGVTATGGPGRVVVTWTPPEGPVSRYVAERCVGGAWEPIEGLSSTSQSVLVVAPLDEGERVEVRVAAVDIAGRRGSFGEPVSAVALAPIREPVFRLEFAGTTAETGQQGTLHGDARVERGLLDTGEDGWIEFAGSDRLQLQGPLSFELWMRPESLTGMPLILSFGHWEGDGYWLQVLGGTYRFYLPIMEVLDAGRPQVGQWQHVAAVYNGTHQILYVDGEEVGRREVLTLSLRPFAGPLRLGHYTDLLPEYHFQGQIDAVRVYQRPLTPDEVRASYEAGR